LISEDYWRSKKVNNSSNSVLSYSDSKFGAVAKVGDFQLFVERRKTATLSANQNALIASANADNVLDASNQGKFSFHANVKSFDYDALGIVFKNNFSKSNSSWELAPKLVQIKGFKTGTGSGDIDIQNNSKNLTGYTKIIQSKPYGYFFNQKETDLGYGFSLDGKLNWKVNSIDLSFEGLNILSGINSSNIYFNNRNYSILSQSGNLLFSQTPSLSGEYGQINKELKLPRILKAQIAHQTLDSNWTQKLGIVNIEGGSIPWASLSYSFIDSRLEARTNNAKNLFLTYSQSNIFKQNLSFEISLGTSFTGINQLAIANLAYAF